MKTELYNPNKSFYHSLLEKEYGPEKARRLVEESGNAYLGWDTWIRAQRKLKKLNQYGRNYRI